MNDSGLVVNRLSGMTETETLRSWTVLLTITCSAGLAVTYLGSKLIPMV
jgi:H+/gluconate symporter-like permease